MFVLTGGLLYVRILFKIRKYEVDLIYFYVIIVDHEKKSKDTHKHRW